MVRAVAVLGSVLAASVAVMNAQAASPFRGAGAQLQAAGEGHVFESQIEAAAFSVGEDAGKNGGKHEGNGDDQGEDEVKDEDQGEGDDQGEVEVKDEDNNHEDQGKDEANVGGDGNGDAGEDNEDGKDEGDQGDGDNGGVGDVDSWTATTNETGDNEDGDHDEPSDATVPTKDNGNEDGGHEEPVADTEPTKENDDGRVDQEEPISESEPVKESDNEDGGHEKPIPNTEPTKEIDNEEGGREEPTKESDNKEGGQEEPIANTEPTKENDDEGVEHGEPIANTEPAKESDDEDGGHEEPIADTEPTKESDNREGGQEEPIANTEPKQENNNEEVDQEEPVVDTEPTKENNDAGAGDDEPSGAVSPPEGCLLSDWEPLAECDAATLTQPFISRVVVPTGDADCVDITQLRKCKPVHCSMGKWSAWSPCNAQSFMVRTREWLGGPLYGGRVCPHSVDRVRCRPEDCLVGSWSDWVCDAESGRKSRSREIVREPKATGRKCPTDLEEEAACDPVDCEVSDDEYEDAWGECDANNNQHRDRKVTTEPLYGGRPCPRREEVWETRACGPVDCAWQRESEVAFSACVENATTNAWVKTKFLEITVQPTEGGKPCPSDRERTIVKPCRPQPCVMDEWIFEGPCSAHGTRRATRAVLTQAKYGAPLCEDQESDVPDFEACPPADCDEFFERTVAGLDCDNAYGGAYNKQRQAEPVVVVRPKIMSMKSQPRYGGRACRPVTECTVEELCKRKQQQQLQQA